MVSKRDLKLEAEIEHFGDRLRCWHGSPRAMQHSHRHSDIELNLVEQGEVRYRFGGTAVVIPAGRLAVFWAARPHQLVHSAAGATMRWLVLPLAQFLRWELPARLRTTLLDGAVVVERSAKRATADAALLAQWQDDLDPAGSSEGAERAETEAIVALELQARLRRLAAAHAPGQTRRKPKAGDAPAGSAERMAHYIAEHFAEPLRVDDIAAQVNVHPSYAMRLFRSAYQLSLGEYIAEHRVAHAQRLLVTTDMSVLDVALASGFTSVSRFYVAFKRACGKTPKAYQATLR